MIKLSDYIIQFLVEKGVKQVHMVVGGGAMHLNDSVGRNKDLEYTCFYHEQALAIASEAHGQFTNAPGVGIVTSGPGGTNTITAVAAAYIDSTPCIFISGQAKRSDLKGTTGVRQMGSQEVDIVSLVASITKYAVTVLEPETIRFHLEKAWHLAITGRKGPVWIDVPLDVQGSSIDENFLKGFNAVEAECTGAPFVKKVDSIIDMLNSAKRPLILAGNGVKLSGAINHFCSFIENNNIPALLTWKTVDFLDYNHPLNFGCPGIMGARYANFIVQNADLILIIGSRLDSSLTAFNSKAFGQNAKKVMIDIDPCEMKKIQELAETIESDALTFFNTLKDRRSQIVKRKHHKWVEHCRTLKKKYPVVQDADVNPDDLVDTYRFVDILFSHLKSDDIITPESSGAAGEVTYQAMKVQKGQLIKNAAGLGAMGFGLPYAIGACLSMDKRRTILVNGDGAFQLNIQELETVRRLKLPIKMFILDNGGYGSIVNTQDNMFDGFYVGATAESGLSLPDMSKIANAYGIRTQIIYNNATLESGIRQSLMGDGAAICIVRVDKTVIAPKVQAMKLPDGNMVSKPIQDMWPYLSEDEIKGNMVVL